MTSTANTTNGASEMITSESEPIQNGEENSAKSNGRVESDDSESSTSAKKLKMDVDQDESSQGADGKKKCDEKQHHGKTASKKSKDERENETNGGDNEADHEEEEEEEEEATKESADTSLSSSTCEQPKKSRKKRDLGLDGGYWSRMPTSSDGDMSTRAKRQRTTVDRLSLTMTAPSNHNRSLNGSRTQHNNNVSASRNSNASDNESTKSTKDRVRLFKAKSFLTVLNDENGFFLCQAINAIYEDSRRCKIQWLEDGDEPNTYKYGVVDWVDPFSIVCKVKVKRIAGTTSLQIDEKDLSKVNILVDKAVKEGGITLDLEEDDDEDSESEIEESVFDLENKDLYDKEDEDDDDDVAENEMKRKKKRVRSKTVPNGFKISKSEVESPKSEKHKQVKKK